MVERDGSHKGAKQDVSSFPSFWSGLESGNCCFGKSWLLMRGRGERDRDRFDVGLGDGLDGGLDKDGLEEGVGDRHRLPTLRNSLTITLSGRLAMKYCQDVCQRRRN